MRKFKKLSLTLALLITAVGGAWAQWTGGTYTATATENLGAITVNGDATLTINSDVTVTVTGGINVASGTLTVTGPGTLVVNGKAGSNGGYDIIGGTGGNGGVAISGNIIVQGGATVTATGGTGGNGGNGEFDGGPGGNGGNAFAGTLTYKSGTVTANGGSAGSGGWGEDGNASSGSAGKAFANDVDFTQTTGYSVTNGTSTIGSVLNQTKVVISGGTDPSAPSGPEPAIEVTTNAASEQDLFTEASFTMPPFDATADYELVRDMSIQMTATMGDGTDGYRIRIKKDGESFVPAEMTLQEMMGLYKVHDGIENQDLVFYGDGKVCDISIFAVDDQDQPTGDAIAFTALTPGRYVAIATAAQGTIYDGQTPASNIFVLYQGYEVEVAAKEFITYYKDEPLYVEDEDAVLYTIQSVSGDQAVLSEKSDAMPSNTPMLVYNKSNETKVILLIPCAEPDMDITVAPEFQGTLTGTTIAASTDAQTNYAFNGKAFVFVKDAIEVGPNKAWLSVNTGVPSARITLVFEDETTKIANTNITNITNGDWYDLNGRKLDKMPTKKGVYLMNGKKVVVK